MTNFITSHWGEALAVVIPALLLVGTTIAHWTRTDKDDKFFDTLTNLYNKFFRKTPQ